MLKALARVCESHTKILIDISGIQKHPVNEARAVLDKQDELISYLQNCGLGVKFLNYNPYEYPTQKDNLFHRPILIEVPLFSPAILTIFIKRMLEDLNLDYEIPRKRRRKNVSYSR